MRERAQLQAVNSAARAGAFPPGGPKEAILDAARGIGKTLPSALLELAGPSSTPGKSLILQFWLDGRGKLFPRGDPLFQNSDILRAYNNIAPPASL